MVAVHIAFESKLAEVRNVELYIRECAYTGCARLALIDTSVEELMKVPPEGIIAEAPSMSGSV